MIKVKETMKHLKRIFENEDILRGDEEIASDLGIRNFTIIGVEELKPGRANTFGSTYNKYKLIGRKNGELCHVIIDSKGDIKFLPNGE